MTIELSIVPASPDGNSFEIIARDVTGISDADLLRHFQEGVESPYPSLFVFEREPSKRSGTKDSKRFPEHPSGGVFPEDLEPLRNFQSDVYILINTRSESQKRLSVFAGMAGINEGTAENFWGSTDANLERAYADSCLGLAHSLEKQSVEPPSMINSWDLAVVIPIQRYTEVYFEKLCNTMAEFKEFFPRHKLPNSIELKKKENNSNFHYQPFIDLSSIAFDVINFLFGFAFAIIAEVGLRLLVEVLKRILREWSDSENPALPPFIDQSIRSKETIKNSEVTILNIEANNNSGIVSICLPFATDSQSQSHDFEE